MMSLRELVQQPGGKRVHGWWGVQSVCVGAVVVVALRCTDCECVHAVAVAVVGCTECVWEQ